MQVPLSSEPHGPTEKPPERNDEEDREDPKASVPCHDNGMCHDASHCLNSSTCKWFMLPERRQSGLIHFGSLVLKVQSSLRDCQKGVDR